MSKQSLIKSGAALGRDPGLLAELGAALQPVFVPVASFGPRLVFLGDSITAGSNDNTNQTYGFSYPLVTQLLLGGRGITVRNAGIPGATTQQMLARFDTDVAPYKPNVVVLLGMTNNLGKGQTFQQVQDSVKALVAKIQGIGASPVLSTIPPRDLSSLHGDIATWNTWITYYAASIGAPLIDFHSALTDPATGYYKAGLGSDGTHPTPAGAIAMATVAADVLKAYLRPWSPPLVKENTDPVQLLGNVALMTADTNADGVPDGWTAYGGSSGYTHSLISDAAVMGKMARIAQAANASVRILERNIGAPAAGKYAVGDKLMVAGVLSADGGVSAEIKLDFQGASKSMRIGSVTATVTRGVWYAEAVVPTGTTTVLFQVITGGGTGFVQFGQPTVYNLTALGLA